MCQVVEPDAPRVLPFEQWRLPRTSAVCRLAVRTQTRKPIAVQCTSFFRCRTAESIPVSECTALRQACGVRNDWGRTLPGRPSTQGWC